MEGRKHNGEGVSRVRDARGLTPTESRFLALCDGTMTLQEVTARMGWSSMGSARAYFKKLQKRGAMLKKDGGTVVYMKSQEQPATGLRVPSQEQKRQIFEMLGVVYDTKAGRFTGCESDVTVATALGNGILFGWVAAIREEFFGPAGGNEELEKLQSDMRDWQDMAQAVRKQMDEWLPKLTAAQNAVAEMQRRMDALVKAAGPRGRV